VGKKIVFIEGIDPADGRLPLVYDADVRAAGFREERAGDARPAALAALFAGPFPELHLLINRAPVGEKV